MAGDWIVEDWLCRYVAYHAPIGGPVQWIANPLSQVVDTLEEGYQSCGRSDGRGEGSVRGAAGVDRDRDAGPRGAVERSASLLPAQLPVGTPGPFRSPFVVSLSNHNWAFDKLRPNGEVRFYPNNQKALAGTDRCLVPQPASRYTIGRSASRKEFTWPHSARS